MLSGLTNTIENFFNVSGHPDDYLVMVTVLIVCSAFISALIALLIYSYLRQSSRNYLESIESINFQIKDLFVVGLALTVLLFSSFIFRIYLPYSEVAPEDSFAVDEQEVEQLIEDKKQVSTSLKGDILSFIVLLFSLPATLSISALLILVYKKFVAAVEYKPDNGSIIKH